MELATGTATVEDLDGFVEKLGEISDRQDCAIQAFDARYVAGPDHLRRAVELADRSMARGENVARERDVEILLYAAGRRQIDRALEMGVSEGGCPVVIVVADPDASDDSSDDGADLETDAGDGEVGDAEGVVPAEREAASAVARLSEFDSGDVTFGNPERLRDFFEITDEERSATTVGLETLVLERVALLDVEK
jgi:KEOPS complex subunit Cgi121